MSAVFTVDSDANYVVLNMRCSPSIAHQWLFASLFSFTVSATTAVDLCQTTVLFVTTSNGRRFIALLTFACQCASTLRCIGIHGSPKSKPPPILKNGITDCQRD